MKVIVEDKPKLKKLCELRIGATFMYNDCLYVKLENDWPNLKVYIFSNNCIDFCAAKLEVKECNINEVKVSLV